MTVAINHHPSLVQGPYSNTPEGVVADSQALNPPNEFSAQLLQLQQDFECLRKQLEEKDKQLQEKEQTIQAQARSLDRRTRTDERLSAKIDRLKEKGQDRKDEIAQLQTRLIQLERQLMQPIPTHSAVIERSSNSEVHTDDTRPTNQTFLAYAVERNSDGTVLPFWKRGWEGFKKGVFSVGRFCRDNTEILSASIAVSGGILAYYYHPYAAVILCLVGAAASVAKWIASRNK
jgi:hypothetical protein